MPKYLLLKGSYNKEPRNNESSSLPWRCSVAEGVQEDGCVCARGVDQSESVFILMSFCFSLPVPIVSGA